MGASCWPTSASMRAATGSRLALPAAGARPGGPQVSAAAWFTLSPARCPAPSRLAANAAARAGAGYVRVSTSRSIDGSARVDRPDRHGDVNDERIGCLLVGPGMGDIPQVLTLALTSHAPKVIDADAITHARRAGAAARPGRDPHAARGRVRALFGKLAGSKAERALEAARKSRRGDRVYKGPDTLVASPDGRLGFAPPAPAWLASAGTGDVLAGMIAATAGEGA